MEDQYWRFANLKEATSALIQAKVIRSGTTDAIVGALDWVGTIYYGGKFDYAARRLTSPPLAYSGYHVNYRGPVVSALAQFRIFPKSPSRRFS